MKILKIQKLILTEKQNKILEEFAKSKSESMYLMKRSKIILAASKGLRVKEIKETQELNYTTVKKWIMRWLEAREELETCEKETPRKLKKLIKKILTVQKRSGRNPTCTAEQVIKIIPVSLETPENYGLEISNWTYLSLTKKVIELGIVDTISESQVRRFLKGKRPKS